MYMIQIISVCQLPDMIRIKMYVLRRVPNKGRVKVYYYRYRIRAEFQIMIRSIRPSSNFRVSGTSLIIDIIINNIYFIIICYYAQGKNAYYEMFSPNSSHKIFLLLYFIIFLSQKTFFCCYFLFN